MDSWGILVLGVARWYREQHVHSLDDLTKDAVFVIQPWGWNMGNKELGTISVWSSVRHRKDTRLVVPQLGMKFICEAIPWATAPGSCWIPTLGHKICNYPVKDGVVIEVITCQKYEIIDRVRNFVSIKLNGEVPFISVEYGLVRF